MTRRDLAWRIAGFALTASSCMACAAMEGSPLTVLFFPTALLGLPFLVHGKRVAQMFHAERRGHSSTAWAIHTQRIRRRERTVDRVDR